MDQNGKPGGSPRPGRVLVVDDEERNRRLLNDILAVEGYDVVEAADGQEALDIVRDRAPDVILLDVMMPKIDGYEVCRTLKQAPETSPVPVLMVTALHDREDLLQGIRAGADDFLSKPVDGREIQLRVRNAVRTRQMHDEIQESYRRLRNLEGLRDKLTHMIVHDMRSPLMIMDIGLQCLEEDVGERIDEEARDNLTRVRAELHRLLEMANAMLDVSRLEQHQVPLRLQPGDLGALARNVAVQTRPLYRARRIEVEIEPDLPGIAYDGELVERVFVNLVSNAIRHTQEEGSIRIHVGRSNGAARVEVADDGIGIPPADHQRIFEKFGQVDREKAKYSTGLGLSFCKLAVESHGGAIGVESEEGQGSRFWFTLPLQAAAEKPGRPDGELHA